MELCSPIDGGGQESSPVESEKLPSRLEETDNKQEPQTVGTDTEDKMVLEPADQVDNLQDRELSQQDECVAESANSRTLEELSSVDEKEEAQQDSCQSGEQPQPQPQPQTPPLSPMEDGGKAESPEPQDDMSMKIDDNADDPETKDDDSTDKGSEGKSQTNEDQEGNNQLDNEQSTSTLGRNRRVRQKNRYFLDFHCTDLTKGSGRSNKCDYDTNATANNTSTTTTTAGIATNAPTRSSNRSKSPEMQWTLGDLDNLPEVYCRKCRARTPHSEEDGCQVCIYNKAVESWNRKEIQKSHRNKSKPILAEKYDLKSRKSAGKSSNKRRASTKQQSSRSKTNSSQNKTISQANVINNNGFANSTSKQMASLNYDANLEDAGNHYMEISDMHKSQVDVCDNDSLHNGELEPDNGTVSAMGSDRSVPIASSDPNEISRSPIVDSKLPKLDLWSPEEVADYISSKGFSQEAERFKLQSVDGISLLLMQRTDFTYGLKIKLGPALKIYDQVCKLKREYFKVLSVAS